MTMPLAIIITQNGLFLGRLEMDATAIRLSEPVGIQISASNGAAQFHLAPLAIPSKCISFIGSCQLIAEDDMEPRFQKQMAEIYKQYQVSQRSGLVLA